MRSFKITLEVDHDFLTDQEVAEIFDHAMFAVAEAHDMDVVDFTVYQIFTGKK